VTPGEDTPAIVTRGLARSFGQTQAVAGLDLDVRRGDMFGLVGPDGAGKSTAIRLLCGLLQPTAGDGRVLGFDLRRDVERIKPRIGYLSQAFTLYGDLTLDENIAFFADIHGVRDYRPRRDELLRLTGLLAFRDRLAERLSGGMKKKLALACTLIHTPDLIFLDEPSTGVDPVSRGEFWNILSEMVSGGMTVLLTTPYLDEAERCERIGLMHRGRIVMTGTPDEIKRRMPGHVYRLTCANPAAAYRALRSRWSSTHLVLYADHLHLWTGGGEPDVRSSADALDGQGFGPVRWTEEPPSMEDAFVALVTAESGAGEHP
jgi:ABC-2 type transport system ATP-binding protein